MPFGGHLNGGTEISEHFFGMVAGGLRFDHGRASGCVEGREQDRRFDLRRGDRGAVGDRQRGRRAADRDWTAATFGLRDDCDAHLLQRIENTPHRSLSERGVAIKGRRDVMAADNAHHESRARTRIAEIEHAFRAAQAANSNALNQPFAVAEPFDPRAERAAGFGRPEHIVTLQQARHMRLTNRQEPENHRAM